MLQAALVKERKMEEERAMRSEDFRRKLHELFDDARKQGETTIIVRSGDLHCAVGGYPGPNHRIPVCCGVMRQERRESDRIVEEPPKGNGATLRIEYHLPR
jgi:5-methylcytosine-specific restriction protein A